MPAALAVADKEKDLGAGGSFLEKQMAGAGFNAPMMQETINNFMVSNTAREQQYAKDNKNIVESFYLLPHHRKVLSRPMISLLRHNKQGLKIWIYYGIVWVLN